mmetsp:Transcript_17709/g.71468  ORF Transcript_17709/g.71468 Transcript_17709/m.71468 type:complete len:335 (-) Transcript_17709:538-1542(-)|eukprot:CAMPEP_0113954012 /NCGR_PEP_ID=MMETSP0011_2-20120614/190_1 /TAXON_ID=101924 /ORGANISM="Rhodosorus marinus" /LENGTH=334 /DNA_ID=CAMNT_0000962841 /DNA_START=1231 /DNA_END=2235 /DNA_ORIENTATION=+ /assembly_acc=CAM_ASM_000156
MNDDLLESQPGRRALRRARRMQYTRSAQQARGTFAMWTFGFIGLLAGLTTLVVALFGRASMEPDLGVQSVDGSCRLEDSRTMRHSKPQPAALAIMPVVDATGVRIRLEKMTGYVTAAAICDPRLKADPGLKHECGDVNKALVTLSAAPLRNATGEDIEKGAYESVVFLPRNPLDWIYMSYMKAMSRPLTSGESIPQSYVVDSAAVYQDIFRFWSLAKLRRLMIPFEDLLLNDLSKWNQVVQFLGIRPSESRMRCAMKKTPMEEQWDSEIASFESEEWFTEESKSYLAEELARELCIMGYDQKFLEMNVKCEDRWLEEKAFREELDVMRTKALVD